MKHTTILIDNTQNSSEFISDLLSENKFPYFCEIPHLKGEVLSTVRIEEFIHIEENHDLKPITKSKSQSLKSMSSGEQKKIVLDYLIATNPQYLILDNPFDNLDHDSVIHLKSLLEKISKTIILIVLLSRISDTLDFIDNTFRLNQHGQLNRIDTNYVVPRSFSKLTIPKSVPVTNAIANPLIHLKNVSVTYQEKRIINSINWTINQGEFWQLKGVNGSGKTTLLSMITGENSKGYGQELYLFGQKKGSGESIWDIKKKIGYYAPTLTHNFYGEHTAEHMIISGLNDSIGLYKHPTELQVKVAREWLNLLNLFDQKNDLFIDLPLGKQRLIMVARAMVKHPLVLILDEPTENLDDESAALFVALTNKIASESNTAIIFVSHRDEPGLKPKNIFKLQPSELGSIGVVQK